SAAIPPFSTWRVSGRRYQGIPEVRRAADRLEQPRCPWRARSRRGRARRPFAGSAARSRRRSPAKASALGLTRRRSSRNAATDVGESPSSRCSASSLSHVDSLPSNVRAVVDRLRSAPVRSVSELGSDLDAFERALTQRDSHHPFADVDLARRVARGCRALLADPDNQAPERLRLVQVAVDYLRLARDAEPDAESVLGFDDDGQVFDAVARALGRSDLVTGGPEA